MHSKPSCQYLCAKIPSLNTESVRRSIFARQWVSASLLMRRGNDPYQNISLGSGLSSAGWSLLTIKSPVIILA